MPQYKIDICTRHLDSPTESDIVKSEVIDAPSSGEAERSGYDAAMSVPGAIGYRISDHEGHVVSVKALDPTLKRR